LTVTDCTVQCPSIVKPYLTVTDCTVQCPSIVKSFLTVTDWRLYFINCMNKTKNIYDK